VLDWPLALRAAIPATLASVAGAWLALRTGDREFRRLLALLMLAITLGTLVAPWLTRRLAPAEHAEKDRPAWALLMFVVAGFYGGFVQAGVGFLVLAATTLAGLDLVRGNAIKVLVILLVTVAALGLFAWDGKVQWGTGLALAVGSIAGGLVGVRLAILKGDKWLRFVVTISIVVFAVLLWLR
jgi:hypothetical protein